jgi:hypothetical protein
MHGVNGMNGVAALLSVAKALGIEQSVKRLLQAAQHQRIARSRDSKPRLRIATLDPVILTHRIKTVFGSGLRGHIALRYVHPTVVSSIEGRSFSEVVLATANVLNLAKSKRVHVAFKLSTVWSVIGQHSASVPISVAGPKNGQGKS